MNINTKELSLLPLTTNKLNIYIIARFFQIAMPAYISPSTADATVSSTPHRSMTGTGPSFVFRSRTNPRTNHTIARA